MIYNVNQFCLKNNFKIRIGPRLRRVKKEMIKKKLIIRRKRKMLEAGKDNLAKLTKK